MALDQGHKNLNGPAPNGVPDAEVFEPASVPTPGDPSLQKQLALPTFNEPRADQLDIRRQLHTIRKHLIWVALMSLLSGGAAAYIGMRGELPWRAQRSLVIRRDSFVRVSQGLLSYLSEDTLTSNVRKAAEEDEEVVKLLGDCKLAIKTQGINKLVVTAEGPAKDCVKKLVDSIEPVFNNKFDELRAETWRKMTKKKAESEAKLVRIARNLKDTSRDRRRADIIRAEFEREKLKYETLLAKEKALKREAGEAASLRETGEDGVPLRVKLSATDLKRKRLVEQIVTLEMSQADFSNRYTAEHPRVRSISAKLTRLRQELASLAAPEPRVSSSGGREIDVLKILMASILESSSRKEVLDRYVKKAEAKVAGAASEAQLRIQSELLHREMVTLNERMTRLEAVGAITPLVAPNAAKLTPPRPTWERLMRAVPFGLLLGAVMGILFAMGMEHLRDTCCTPSEIQQDLGLTTLAIIPRLEAEGGICISPNEPHSDLAEMFSILRNNLRYSEAESPEKRVMVTSSLSGDGKSMIAMNLAVSFSFEGLSVLLVDADMRRSKGYMPILGGANGPGLVPWLEGEIEAPEEALTASLIPGLSVMTAGGKANNATKLVASPRMEYLLSWAEDHFDVVIIDTPAVLPVADTTMFASMAHAVLMVIDAPNTRTGAARAAISRLVHTRGNVVGAVLNRADQRALGYMSYYGAKYGYGYGYRYGYKSYK